MKPRTSSEPPADRLLGSSKTFGTLVESAKIFIHRLAVLKYLNNIYFKKCLKMKALLKAIVAILENYIATVT